MPAVTPTSGRQDVSIEDHDVLMTFSNRRPDSRLKIGARKTSKVMLLFPPEWVPTAPYLALPSLTAVLREAGHQVIQRDINIEMYDHFFTTEFLIWIKARQSMQLKALEAKEEAAELTDQEAGQKAVLEQRPRSMCSIWRRAPKRPSASCGASSSTKPTSSNGR